MAVSAASETLTKKLKLNVSICRSFERLRERLNSRAREKAKLPTTQSPTHCSNMPERFLLSLKPAFCFPSAQRLGYKRQLGTSSSWTLFNSDGRLHVNPRFPQRSRHLIAPISMRTPKQGMGRTPGRSSGEEKSENSETGSPQKLDSATLKRRLLKILDSLINLKSQHGKVEQLILQLESLNVKPITDSFTEMALAGEWKLVFSSMRISTDGQIRFRKIGQLFDVERKTLQNSVVWSFPAADGKDEILACLSVTCDYKFVGPGRLEVGVPKHVVDVFQREDGKKINPPKDMKRVISTLQLALPIDFWDPSGLLDVSYIEPNFRLARTVGRRLAGVRSVFVRAGTEG